MKTVSRFIVAGFIPLATLLCLGCGTPAAGPPATDQPAHADHDHGAASEFSEQLAKLTPEDRTAAEAQMTCPVSDQPLGSMGVPPKVTVNGRAVFLCCLNCEEELNKNPDKYLEKLAQ